MIRKHWLTITSLFLGFIGFFVSCVSEDFPGGSVIQPGTKERYIQLELNLPDFVEPTSKSSTRAMGEEEERAIDLKALHILVFDTTEDTLMYKAPIVPNSLIVNENKATVTVKMVKSENPIDFTLLTLANYDLNAGLIKAGITLKEAETKLAELNSKLTFSMPGEKGEDKWNTGTDTNPYTRFPMWGQKSMSGSITEQESALLELKMYRALARIDVGLNFNSDNETGNFLESATGLDNFKLEKIYIYKTYNQGYLERKEKKDEFGELKPFAEVPTNAKRNENPLIYTLGETEIESNCYVREIYVPEAQESTKDSEVHCIVVGGYYEGNSTLSYYRLDFAERDIQDQTKITHLPILRNHRYIFNIKGVKYAGSTSADNAFKDGFNPSNKDFVYDLIVWDEDIHEMHVHGKYHFGLDSRDIVLKGKPSILKDESGNPLTEKTGNFKKIVYQTNYPLSESNSIAFEWENPVDSTTPSVSEYFSVAWDNSTTGQGILTLTAKKSNLTGNDITDVLKVKAGTFEIKVNVTQQYINFNYTLDCGSLIDHGTYKAGVELGDEHYLTVDLIAEDRSCEGEEYELWVEKTNGISFRAKAKFDFTGITKGDPLIVPVKLTLDAGKQMIPKEVIDPFTVVVKSNSPLHASCEIDITPVFTYNMVMAATARNTSININNNKTGPYKVLNSKLNFGPNYNSLTKIADFNYITFDNTEITNVGWSRPISGSRTDAEHWIRGTGGAPGQAKGQIADIVYLSFNTCIKTADGQMYKEYLEKGGVIIAFIEYAEDIKNFMNGTLGTTLTVGNRGVNGGYGWWGLTDNDENYRGNIIPFPANDKLVSGESKEKVLNDYDNDMVLNGPFGDVRELQWGQDNTTLGRIYTEKLAEIEGITIYSKTSCWRWENWKAYVDGWGGNRRNKANHNVIWDENRGDYVTAFKEESDICNFIWFGDSGFMSSGWTGTDAYVSNNKETIGHTEHQYRGLEPFAWDEYNYPAPKKMTNGHEAYNSTVFCNIFAWALKRSDQLRAKRESYISQ